MHSHTPFSKESLFRLPKLAWVVSARWHTDVVEATLKGAKIVFEMAAPQCKVIEINSPGTLEIPQLLDQGLKQAREKPEVVLVLGCVIRGETAHFDLIANSVFSAIHRVAMEHQVVITNGLLTTENLVQALDRSGGSKGNKGMEAAEAALQLFSELERIKTL